MAQAKLLTSRRFFPLFATQFLGAFNDNFFKNALIMMITFKASSVFGIPAAQITAAAGGLFILPFFLFSAQSGQLADKFEKSRLIRLVKGAEIFIMGIAAAGFLLPSFELLAFALFLMGVHSTVFGPIKYSILPQIVEEEELVGANALVEAATFLAILLGTIAGGVLVMLEGNGPLLVSIGIVATAVVGYLTSLFVPEAKPVDPDLKWKWNFVTPTWSILQDTRRTRSVFLSILGISWFWFFGGFLLSLFPSYCKEFLRADGSVVTLFLAIFSIGIMVGSLLCETMSRRNLELGLVPFGSIGMSLFALDIYLLGDPGVSAVGATGIVALLSQWQGVRLVGDLFLIAVFGGFFIVPLYTLIQTRSEKSHRSRIIAGNNILNAAFMVVSSLLLVGLINAHVSPPTMFLVLAGINAVVALYIYTLLPEFFLRFMVWGIANIMYRVKVEGADNIPRTGPALVICNHVSFVDWMILAAVIKRPARFIMDHHVAQGRFMKALAKQAKIIPIAPAKEDKAMMEAAFQRAGEELREGEIVCLFPEGAITRNGKMSSFRPGIERLQRETPVPVVPIALLNMWGSIFSRKDGPALLKRPKRFWSRIRLRIGAPSGKFATAAELAEKVAALLGEPPPPAYEPSKAPSKSGRTA